MVSQVIKRQSIVPRIDGIQQDVQKLKQLSELSLTAFSEESNFIKAQFYLRRALEGVFHIGSHILARLPGGRATEYKEIALKLGEMGIVDENFAQNQLKKMAGYRNRLTHFYADIKPEEIHAIIKDDIGDFDEYLKMIKRLLDHPEKFNLTLE